MKLLISFIFIVCCHSAHAEENFSYSQTPQYSQPNLIDVLEVQTELESQGYWPINLSSDQQLAVVGVDQAFFDPFSKKIILLKFGLQVSDASLEKKLVPMNGDYLYHSSIGDHVPYALYFIGHSQSEAISIVRSFGLKENASAMNLFLPEAKATCSDAVFRSLAAINPVAAAMMQGMGPQRLANCGISAFQGARTSVKGMANSAKQFFTHPQEFWQTTKNSFNEFWNFVQNIHIEVSKLVVSLGGLDADTALQIGCTVAGELLPGVLISAASGAGIAKFLPQLALRIAALRKLGPVLLAWSAEKRAKRLANAEKAIQRMVSCAL